MEREKKKKMKNPPAPPRPRESGLRAGSNSASKTPKRSHLGTTTKLMRRTYSPYPARRPPPPHRAGRGRGGGGFRNLSDPTRYARAALEGALDIDRGERIGSSNPTGGEQKLFPSPEQ